MSPSPRIRIGAVGRPHGLRGAVRVHLDNPDSESLTRLAASHTPIFVGGEPRTLKRVTPLPLVRSARTRPWLLELEGVTDRTLAEALFRLVVEADRAALGPLDDGEFYYADLVGLECVTETGEAVGRVARMYESGASDILVLDGPTGERELPFVDSVIVAVELARSRVVVRIPDEEEVAL